MRDGKHVILCVDDDQDLLDVIRLVIESEGYIMAEATTAEDGLRRFKEEKPDFILVDLMMEEVDAGTNLVKELKALGDTTPVYMLSSAGDALHQSTDCAALGLNGVLQKPIDPKVLIATLKGKLS